MKLAYPEIQQVIRFEAGRVSSLVIEQPSLMFRFLSDIRHQLCGEEGKTVLSVDNIPVSMERWADLLVDFVGFDGHRKSLVTKILHVIERTAQEEAYLQETQQMMAGLEAYLDRLAYEQDLELSYEKLSLANLLKAVGIRFEGEKLFLLVNLRSFVQEDELKLFLETVIAHGWKVLLLDSHADTLLPLENRILIDRDLCEI